MLERFALYLDAVSGRRRREVVAGAHDHRIDEMFVQMIDVFETPPFERRAHADVIEDREVLDVFA